LAKDLRRDEITLVVARLRTRMEEQFADAGVTEAIGRSHFPPDDSSGRGGVRQPACVSPEGVV
jgi:hypothetical protein